MPGINVSVNFYVEFSNINIPSVTAVRLNGRTICSGRKKIKPLPSPTPFISRKITSKTVPSDYTTESVLGSQYYKYVYFFFGVNYYKKNYFSNYGKVNLANSDHKHTYTSSDVGAESDQEYDPNKFLPPTQSSFNPTRTPEDNNDLRIRQNVRDKISSNPQYKDGNGTPTDDTEGIGAQPLLLANSQHQCGKRASINVSPLILYGKNSTEGL